MTFSEANRESRFITHHTKKTLNNISCGCVTLQFYGKYPLKFHSNYKYLVSYRATANYFNKQSLFL